MDKKSLRVVHDAMEDMVSWTRKVYPRHLQLGSFGRNLTGVLRGVLRLISLDVELVVLVGH